MKTEIQIPTHCPSCNSELEMVNSQLFCRNKNCSAQSSKRVEAFVKKMKIKGLGPKSISKLGFVHPIEIYETTLDTYVEILGEKIGQKIFDEIENSKNTTFATFLSALSIPLIGDTASKKIATQVTDLLGLFEWLEEINIGDKAKANIKDWMETSDFWLAGDLEKYLNINKQVFKEVPKKGKVCITGKLKDFKNRNECKEYLEELGYTVTSTVSSVTDYLVCEDGSNSSKSKKAESLGIPIVTIENLIER
jgi:DNA ligase (NAD+)